jgi:Protein of unknown function (DUF3775)
MAGTKTIDAEETVIPLEIDPPTVAFLIAKARAFDAKVAPAERDTVSQPGEDEDHGALEDFGDDPVGLEIKEIIDDLNDDAQVELVAMTWVGRGDFSLDEWQDAIAAAAERKTGSTAVYLLGMPLLGDLLEEGFVTLGYSCEDYDVPV